MSSHADDYRALGVQPGCSMQALKAARRRLVKSWHPDHFPSGSDKKRQAEERIKTINTAFDRLVDYHRNFGVLPSPAVAAVSESSTGAAEPARSESTDPGRAPRPETETHPSRPDRRLRAFIRWALVLAAIVLIAEAMRATWQLDSDAPSVTEPPPVTSEPLKVLHPQPPAPQSAPDEYFTVGSSLGEVYAVQGVPTATENGVWHYGKSKVHFANGAVTSWDHDSADPLKATLLPQVAKHDPHTFTIGSTKAEVRTAQGSPLIETDNLWDYGLSKVHFRDDRVVSWESSPMRPLKARK